MRTTALGAPAALVILLALSACGPADTTPTDSPTPRASTSTDPTPVETPSGPDPQPDGPDQIAIDTTVFVIGGPADDEVHVFDYFRPAGPAVEALTTAFGASPTVTVEPAGPETAATTRYDWGGFTLNDPEGTGDAPAHPDFWVRVTADEVDGIPIITHVAIQVGTAMSDVAAVQDGSSEVSAESSISWIFSQPIDPVDVGEPPGSDLRIFVAVHGPAGGSGTVREIIAPSVNFGP